MKEKDGIFKFVAAAMLFAAAACAIVAYWEQIVDLIRHRGQVGGDGRQEHHPPQRER